MRQVLLAGAGMLLTTLIALQAARTGFNMTNVLAVNVPARSFSRGAEQVKLYKEALRRISELPGVERVAVGTVVPWRDAGGFGPGFQFSAEGYAKADGEEDPRARFRTVSPGFFAALGVPIIAGRDFNEADRSDAEPVVIVSQSVAQRMFSSGDAVNCHEICSTLASSDRLISPTRFHNSVHNAASGYWSISSGAMATSSVVCARDASFAAGLLEAMTQVAVEQVPVLLVAYDTDYPEPLRSARTIPDSFGVALVLTPNRSERSQAQWTLEPADCLSPLAADRLDNPALETLRLDIPAARCLPLLRGVANRQSGRIMLDYLEGSQLALQVAP